MQTAAHQERISALRARIAAIEKRPLLAAGAGASGAVYPGGLAGRRDGDWQALLKAPAGVLHEVFAEGQRDGGAALGFALGLARGLVTPDRPAMLFLQLAHEAQDGGLPYGTGLKSFGIDPEMLILGRLATPVELLWAMEEAIACRAVAGVIADVGGHPKALDFTASRRLGLKAASAGTSVFMLRYGREREASAARLRWRVTPAPSRPPPFDAEAPGLPRWQVALEKGRLQPGVLESGVEFMVDWTSDGFAPAACESPGGRGHPGPAPYGAQPAVLGDRMSQAG